MANPLTNYEPVSKEAAAYTKGLITVWKKLGEPTDCSNNTGWVMLDNIIQVWQKAWPWEMAAWQKQIKEELGAERTIREALNAGGGYFPVSYPTRLYKMIKGVLPHQKLNDKKFLRKLIKRYPFLHSSNYRI